MKFRRKQSVYAHAHPHVLLGTEERLSFCSQFLAEQKGLSDSGEDPVGEVESPDQGMGHPKSPGGCNLEAPAPTVACVSAESRLGPISQELAGVSPNLPHSSGEALGSVLFLPF